MLDILATGLITGLLLSVVVGGIFLLVVSIMWIFSVLSAWLGPAGIFMGIVFTAFVVGALGSILHEVAS